MKTIAVIISEELVLLALPKFLEQEKLWDDWFSQFVDERRDS